MAGQSSSEMEVRMDRLDKSPHFIATSGTKEKKVEETKEGDEDEYYDEEEEEYYYDEEDEPV